MISPRTAGAVICGAGIAGIAAAYFLTVRCRVPNVAICDPRPPLTLTSDKSTECYRNWWPSAPVLAFMNRSIDLLEELATESGNTFRLNRRGYLYVTGDETRFEDAVASAQAASDAGAGPLRRHHGEGGELPYFAIAPEGWRGQPTGADVLMGSGTLETHFPYLSEAARGAVHVRRAGWLSAQQLGAWMLERAQEHSLTIVPRAVAGVDVGKTGVQGVRLDDGSTIKTERFLNAAGPLLADVGALVDVALPVHSEVHLKVAFKDHLGAIPREAPMLIWTDPQRVDWSEEERSILHEEGRDDLLGMMPPGCHGRPEGGPDSPWVVMLWEYRKVTRAPAWPLPLDPFYFETVLRGMATMIPALSAYRARLPEPIVDGGYYTKTAENRPLIGPMGPTGSFVVGALSGFGIMAACAAGELAALHLTGRDLPTYAPSFALDRYEDPDYRHEIVEMTDSGQI